MTQSAHHVVLVGLMGSGKTTAGRALADVLGLPFSDSDAWIEARCGFTGRQVAQRDGVDDLHRLEAAHLLEALASAEPLVVAAAASVVDDERCLAALEQPFVVWLDPPVATLSARISSEDHRRDLSMTSETFAQLRARRSPAYAAAADFRITAALTAPEITDRVLRVLRST